MANLPKVTVSLHKNEVKEKGERDGDKVGKTTGLKLTHFFNELLRHNVTWKLDDADMLEVVRAEFPKRDVIQAIAAYRSYANAGKHGFQAPKGGADRFGVIVREVKPKTGKGKKPAKGGEKAPKGKKPASKGKGKPAQPAKSTDPVSE